MKIFLAHIQALAKPPEHSAVAIHRRLAEYDTLGRHTLAGLDDADVILFTEGHHLAASSLRAIREDPVYRANALRSYVFDQRDMPWCEFAGIYVSYPADLAHPGLQAPWSYTPIFPIRIEPASDLGDPDLLFSFVGSPTAAVREKIFSVEHPHAICERVLNFTFYVRTSPHYDYHTKRFAEILRRSKFVLCPRGQGLSSIRLYETLSAGRVPIILADRWWPPSGPHWDNFSVRWPERRVDELPRYLESIEPRWEPMAMAAREAWAEWFDKTVWFSRMGDALETVALAHGAERCPPKGLRDEQFWRATGTRFYSRGRVIGGQALSRVRRLLP